MNAGRTKISVNTSWTKRILRIRNQINHIETQKCSMHFECNQLERLHE